MHCGKNINSASVQKLKVLKFQMKFHSLWNLFYKIQETIFSKNLSSSKERVKRIFQDFTESKVPKLIVFIINKKKFIKRQIIN